MSANDQLASPPAAISAERVVVTLTITLLLLMNAIAVGMQIGRPLDHDEGEYLHAAWLMDRGKQIYRDFMEDHPPFLFQVLQLLKPKEDASGLDVFHWTVRGRIFSAACGTWAMLAASLIVWRITRNGAAAALTLGALLGARWTWLRALADIRADAPTVALFLTGLLLLIWDDRPSWRMAWRIGAGIGVAFAAELWNPKWPLVGLCLGAFFIGQCVRLLRVRAIYLVAAIVPPLIAVAAVYGALVAVATPGDYLYFIYIFKSHNMYAFASQGWVAAAFKTLSPLHHAPPRFAGVLPAVLFMLAVLVTAREWRRLDSDRKWRTALVLGATLASGIEVRFLYSWPYIWPQFFLMLSFMLAMTYGLLSDGIARAAAELRTRAHVPQLTVIAVGVASAIAIGTSVMYLATKAPAWWTLLLQLAAVALAAAPLFIAARAARRHDTLDVAPLWRFATIGAALALSIPHLAETIDFAIIDTHSASWPARQELQERLRPGETVWVGAARHPVAAYDASYLWYSFADLVPMTFSVMQGDAEVRRHMPALTVGDLPICRLANGEAGPLRFIEISAYAEFLPGACGCAQAALNAGNLVPTRVPSVYEVARPGGRYHVTQSARDWDAFVRDKVAACARR